MIETKICTGVLFLFMDIVQTCVYIHVSYRVDKSSPLLQGHKIQ